MKERNTFKRVAENPRLGSSQNEQARIALVGCGVTSAVGRGVEALRHALRTNASGLKESVRFDHPRYQSKIVGAAPIDSAGLENPAYELAADALEQARAQAHDVLAEIPPSRLGLVLATTKANIRALELLAEGRTCSERARRHVQGDLLAADLAESFGARGPVQTVSVACVSGLVALQQGCKLIQRQSADAVLVVGVDHLSSFVVAGFSALKALDPLGCRPFDRDRRGLSPGEAGAALVLARPTSADSGSVTICGWGNSNDANHMTGPSRDGSGLTLAIRQALDSAGVDATDIDYINAHGTGTAYNDAMETKALRTVFGEQETPVSGTKGMFGHTLGAAGLIETIVCLLALNEQMIPGTPGLTAPEEDAPLGLIRQPRLSAKLEHVLKLAVGFGGVNSALVLSHG